MMILKLNGSVSSPSVFDWFLTGFGFLALFWKPFEKGQENCCHQFSCPFRSRVFLPFFARTPYRDLRHAGIRQLWHFAACLDSMLDYILAHIALPPRLFILTRLWTELSNCLFTQTGLNKTKSTPKSAVGVTLRQIPVWLFGTILLSIKK